jgi:hypothetical protein
MSTGPVDIRADLQAEDDTGYIWTLLRDATDDSIIRAGAIVIAGNSVGRTLAEVVDVVDGPTDKIVHLKPLPGSVRAFEMERARARRAG